MPILADYFMSVTVPPTEENIGLSNPPIEIVDRYPIEDHKKHRFPENSQYCCIPGDAKIKYVKSEKRRPTFFTFCFTLDDRSRSYGTSLFYYEKLKINGEYRYDKKGRHYYVPRSLCILSHQPIFSVFCVFLRELYRYSILSPDDHFADDQIAIPRVESFDALLRKGSSFDVFSEDTITDLPLERYITHFIDVCPSLEPGTLFHIPLFQKVTTLLIPPSSCLPYVDKLCFDCLYSSLSPKNILKCVASILQEDRILLVSEQTDSLTLCALALVSLIYPFRWYHPFIPIIPLSITESVSATFPYIFGVTTSQFESSDCQNNLNDVVVVQLDYDTVTFPKNHSHVDMNRGFVKKFVKCVEKSLPPPMTRILYCNSQKVSDSSFVVFETLFGPGKLGVRLRSNKRVIRENEEKQEITYLARIEDEEITGPGKRVELLSREPAVISINGKSVVGKSHSEVREIVEEAKRPLLMRCQIGVFPADRTALCLQSCFSESTQSEISPIPDGDMVKKETPSSESDLQIRLSSQDSSMGPWSPVLPTPSDEDCSKIHRYYHVVQSKERGVSCDIERIDFYEKTRVMIMMELVRLIGHYKKAFNDDATNGASIKEILNMKSFMKGIDEDDMKFVKRLTKTQLFTHFIEDAFEYEDNYEINLFNDCVMIVKGMGEYAEEYIESQLTPSKWDLPVVDVPSPTKEEESDSVSERWKGLDLIEFDSFPRMQPALYGKKASRMKLEQVERSKTIVPEDMKAVVKALKKKRDE